MKTLAIARQIAALFLVGFSFTGYAQQQEYVNQIWDYTGGILGQNDQIVTKLDHNGNLVRLANSMNQGNSDFYLSCIPPNGNPAWEQTCVGSSTFEDFGVDLAIDDQNNIFFCGAKNDGSTFDIYVAKYSPSGTLIWDFQYNGGTNGVNNLNDVPTAIVLDENNGLFLTGTIDGGSSMTDIVTMKFDATTGQLLWETSFAPQKPQLSTDIILDNSGSVFVCGSSATNAVNSNGIILKYDQTTGSQIGFTDFITSGNGFDIIREMAFSDNGDLYAVGTSKINSSDADIMVLAYDNNLQLLWSHLEDGQGVEDIGNSIDVSNNGMVAITGLCKKGNGGINMFFAGYNATNGLTEFRGQKTALIDEERATGKKVRFDGDNNVVIVGEEDYYGQMKMTTTTKDQTGKTLWSRSYLANNGTESTGNDLVIGNSAVYVTGKSLVSTSDQISTVTYSSVSRDIAPVLDVNGNPYYVGESVLIRFKRNELNLAAIDKIELEAGPLSEFITTTMQARLADKTGFDWSKLQTYKMHRGYTSADSLSVTRLGDTIKTSNFIGTLIIDLPSGENPEVLSANLDSLVGIEIVQPDYYAELYGAPDDVLYANYQFGLYPNSTYPNSDINVQGAWDVGGTFLDGVSVGEEYVTVGVVDNGIDYTHNQFGQNGTLSGSKVSGWNYYANTTIVDTLGYSNHGGVHGTKVAGIIGALRNEGIGVSGIAGGNMAINNRGVMLYSSMISSGDNPNTNFSPTSVIQTALVDGSLSTTNGNGIGLDIQNMAWGYSNSNPPLIRAAVKEGWENHCVLLAARGNNGASGNYPNFPACLPDRQILNVVASGTDGNRKDGFINGSGDWSSAYGINAVIGVHGECVVDFSAPGTVELVTTTTQANPTLFFSDFDPYCPLDSNSNQTYRCFSGTSAAVAHVTGVAALMYSNHHVNKGYDNNLAPEDIEEILQSTANPADSVGVDQASGYGRINAMEAVTKVSNPYYVKHFIYDVDNVSNNWVDNVANPSILIGNNSNGTPQWETFPHADLYRFYWVIEDSVPSNHEIIDKWIVEGGLQTGGNNSNAVSIIQGHTDQVNYQLNGGAGGTHVWGVAETYLYYVVDNVNGNFWYPISPSELQFMYSVHATSSPIVGLDNIEKDGVLLYPNPTTSRITIDYSGADQVISKIKLFDATGRNVKEIDGQLLTGNTVDIGIENLEQGVYYCTLFGSNAKITIPFIVSR